MLVADPRLRERVARFLGCKRKYVQISTQKPDYLIRNALPFIFLILEVSIRICVIANFSEDI